MVLNPSATPDARQRLDRWLWYARFFKTRGLASRAITGGHVKVGQERVKAGHRVKVGDCLEILRDRERFVVRIAALPQRRGPADEARAAYVEDTESQREREHLGRQLAQDRQAMPRTDGRPDKHTRRLLRRRNRGDH